MARLRRPALAILSLLAAALLLACGPTAAPPPAPPPAPTPAASPAPAPTPPRPANPDVILATTTSTQDSGLLDVLVPRFEKQTGYKLKVIAVGTGQALAMGQRGDADVMLVHAPAAEKPVVESGAAIERKLVMHNDFVIVGPAADPAKIKAMTSAAAALKQIAAARATFVSRGDNSGTNIMENGLWQAAGIKPGGDWYLSAGQGMGATLLIASQKQGYTLTDRATYLANKDHLQLDILLQGDAPLLNIYHVMLVNPAKFPRVNAEGARAFADFLLAADTQAVIGKFGADKFGQPLFFPDAGKPDTY